MPDRQPLPDTLQGWLSHLEQLHPKTIALGLDRVLQVRSRMALDPEFTIITVGGTNGKGSTCAMLERILLEAGYHVGCYTSPHLLRYNERVCIDCQEVDDAALCRAFAAVEAARGEVALTYFEFGTLAAVWLFAESSVDVAVLEIGLGGRLDAVNAFDPACAVVTSIDLDHLDYLGNNRDSIGREKAGIFRQGIPAICGDAAPPASLVAHAGEVGAEYRQIGVHFGYDARGQSWDFISGNRRLADLPLPGLYGAFQLENASCALQALTMVASRCPIGDEAICAGLRLVSLKGRYQTLRQSPKIIVDVAHNPHAARGLSRNLRSEDSTGRTLAVFAMLADKDIGGVVAALRDDIDAWFCAGIAQTRGASASRLAELVRVQVHAKPVTASETVVDALRLACRSAGENDRIAAFGSFYTVADVMRNVLTLESDEHGC